MTLEALRDDYRRRLFKQYLPFWEKGACDRRFGGVMCELNDDGSVFDDLKFIWYQGRGLWVYSFLFSHFGKEQHWLDLARQTRDFMVQRMSAGAGRWLSKVHRDGRVIAGYGPDIYAPLHVAEGLLQYYMAAGDAADLALAKQSIGEAMQMYDDPAYVDAYLTQFTTVEISKGMRLQGNTMVLVGALTQFLDVHPDPLLEALQHEHVDHLLHRFWNAEYGISNEYLRHDYSRVSGAEGYMFVGHTVETLWMLLDEALRRRDRGLFDTVAARIRRVLEMSWDYVFEGCGDGDYFVFDTPRHRGGPDYSVKTMWAHSELMVACLTILEYTGAAWAAEWYDRVRAFTLRTMPVATHGVWRQAVDRRGNDLKRVATSTKRKNNYHQARMLMLNLMSLDRIIGNRRRATPFPQ